MPLFDDARAAQAGADLARQSHAVIHGARLPAPPFETRAGGADFLLRALGERQGCMLLVEEAVRYRGEDPELRDCFMHPTHNGWRPLRVLQADDASSALRQADEFLGLAGERRRPAPPREIHAPPPGDEAATRDPDRFGADLVEEARRGRLAPAFFRQDALAALMRILSKQGKNAACLVGEAGVGKTAIVEQLAIEVAGGRAVPQLMESRILDVNLSFVAAGAVHANEFEGRLARILDRARADCRIILFFDEVHTICLPGSNAAQLVKSDLGRGRIRCIGATTPAEFRDIEDDPALARRFQRVRVDELSRDQSIAVLEKRVASLEAHHGVAIPRELIERSVDLSIRFVPDRRLPDKALDLLDEACAAAQVARWQRQTAAEGGGTDERN